MKHIWKKMKHEQGLTLIELLITISVLAVVSAIALPVINNVVAASNSNALQQSIKDAQTFIDKYSKSGVVAYDGLQTLSGYVDADGDGIIEAGEKVDTLTFDDKYELTATGTAAIGGYYSNGGVTAVTLASVDLNTGGAPTPVVLAGYVVGFGENGFGETSIPASISSGSDVKAIAAGGNHALALKNDGTVVAWGYYTSVPTEAASDVKAIAAGHMHSLALKNDGTVVAWGENGDGQATVPAGLNNVVAIAAGGWHSIAIKSDGTVVAWGQNTKGQVTVPAGLTDVTAIAGGYRHTLAVKSDGTVVAWGDNSMGATNVPAGLTGVTAVTGNSYHSAALKSDGTVVVWGTWPGYGQTTVPAGLSNVTALVSSTYTFYALKSDGTIVAWGADDAGQVTGANSATGVVAIAGGTGQGRYVLAIKN